MTVWWVYEVFWSRVRGVCKKEEEFEIAVFGTLGRKLTHCHLSVVGIAWAVFWMKHAFDAEDVGSLGFEPFLASIFGTTSAG